MRGDVLLDDLGIHRLEQALFFRLPQVARVHGHEHVRRGVGTLGTQTGHQGRFSVGGVVDLDTGLFGIGLEYRLDQVILAGGVDHQLLGLGDAGEGAESQTQHDEIAGK